MTGYKRTKRSPLKQKPLRLPGQSVTEARDDLVQDKVLEALFIAMVMILFAGLEWWRWLTKSPPHPFVATVGAVAAVGWAVWRVWRLRPQLKALKLGAEGERVVGQYLEAERAQGWYVLHDIPGEGFNLDHVLIAPQGVFVVETKTHSKSRPDAKVLVVDGKVLVDGFAPDRDPLAQARAARDWLKSLLRQTTDRDFPVRGAVLYPGWWVAPPKGARSEIWVLNEKAFVKWVHNEPSVINPEDVALIHSRLVNYVTH